MYARDNIDESGGETLFAVSGLLWRRSLLMVDAKTGTLWHQLTGRAMKGPREGQTLEAIPATITDWATWRRLHPETTVALMSRTSEDYDRTVYQRLGPFVLGAFQREGAETVARAWPFRELVHAQAINDQIGGQPVLVTFDRRTHSAQIFAASTGDDRAPDELTFRIRDGQLLDRETGSRWNRLTGKAEAGPLEGAQLPAIPSTLSFRQPWVTFFPGGTVYPAPAD